MKGLLLMNKEEEWLVFDVEKNNDNNVNLELYLVGNFLTKEVLRVSIMKERMFSIWRPKRGVSRKMLHGHSYFNFFTNWT